jgi:hypothetical protein
MLASIAWVAAEETLGDLATALKTLWGKPNGLGLAYWIVDEALCMQAIHNVEVKTFPRTAAVEAEDSKECKDGVFDLCLIVNHVGRLKTRMNQYDG